ncbi:larval serum protein 1 beta chain [Drosophila subpulchrella]|uniref:larval serum protein 1 beta chain n=1 Tax=Drosophila subpulchrella TaxID=1486046 RepID=UPI0018A1563A|nr:larval serum protein 1 beta chain [Drosophila subpulchrella]XP_037710596.1 larval serum protein 1 beta chain [Drosophila subpulchrella]
MKIAIVLLACLGLVAAANYHKTHEVKIADKDFLLKQKFLFEIVYRVEDPLMFEEYIKEGQKFYFEESYYTHYDLYMKKFFEAYKAHALLPKGEFFGALAMSHAKQARGLFNFFYYAKDWETFKTNVAWARMHVNEGMFVYALTLAVVHRNDFHGLVLPSIYEIFPQFFFNSKFVYEAEKFDYEMWMKMTMYEKEYLDVYYKTHSHGYGYGNMYQSSDYTYIKDFKTWQWWKLMGLGEHWYSNDKFILRENINEFYQESKWLSMMKDVKKFYMPVDYTRDLNIYNEESKLSYFTEDLGWNAYWYYLNMDYSFFLDGKTFELQNDRRGEWWLYNVHQLLSRYYMERLSHGFGEIPEFSWYHQIEMGYDPQMIYYNGIGYSFRKNYYEMETYANFDMLDKITGFMKRVHNIVEMGYYKTADGHMIDLRKPESVEFIGNMMQGNIDAMDKMFYQFWYMLAHMYFADTDYHQMEVYPNVMLNFETMMRDPMYYMFYKSIAQVYFQFMHYLPKYTKEQLLMPGVTMKHVEVSDLTTYFDLVDFDVTNMLNEKMVFQDGKFVWDKSLFARQMRLNHKPFTYTYTIESEKAEKVVIRAFLGPKYDEFGKMISLTENRMNFMEIDEFSFELKAGTNMITRKSSEFYWTAKDRTTYTELYYYTMMAYEGKYAFPLDISEPHCGFPDRLVLPMGWKKGMPMQMFFMVVPYVAPAHEQFSTFDYTYSCGIGSGARYVDSMPFGYPFDREIDEYEFFVPNMYFKDVTIFHADTMEPYYKFKSYSNYGHFDYTFFNDYYTKYFKF